MLPLSATQWLFSKSEIGPLEFLMLQQGWQEVTIPWLTPALITIHQWKQASSQAYSSTWLVKWLIRLWHIKYASRRLEKSHIRFWSLILFFQTNRTKNILWHQISGSCSLPNAAVNAWLITYSYLFIFGKPKNIVDKRPEVQCPSKGCVIFDLDQLWWMLFMAC